MDEMNLNLSIPVLVAIIAGVGCAHLHPVTVRGLMVPEDPSGNVILAISNQDRTVDPLDVRVLLDGVPIIDATIAIGDLHPSYEQYRFTWPPGIHALRVASKRAPATLVSTIDVTGKLWLSILYGYPPRATEFVLNKSDEAVAWE